MAHVVVMELVGRALVGYTTVYVVSATVRTATSCIGMHDLEARARAWSMARRAWRVPPAPVRPRTVEIALIGARGSSRVWSLWRCVLA